MGTHNSVSKIAKQTWSKVGALSQNVAWKIPLLEIFRKTVSRKDSFLNDRPTDWRWNLLPGPNILNAQTLPRK